MMTNTNIILSDNRLVTIEELSKDYQTNKVYSIKNNKINEMKIVSCYKEDNINELYYIEFYNQTHLTLSSYDEVLMYDGKSRKANKLHIGERLMPFLLKTKNNQQEVTEPKGYYIIKLIKKIKGCDSYCIKAKDGGEIAVIPSYNDNSTNEIGGCFVRSSSN